MSWITITDNETNQILYTVWCKPKKQSKLVEEGQTLHKGKYPVDEYTYNGVDFNLIPGVSKKVNITDRELIIKLIRELESNGIDLSDFRKNLTG